MTDEAQTPDSWIADGAAETEPVTTETPEVVEATEVIEAVTEVLAETAEIEGVPADLGADFSDEDLFIIGQLDEGEFQMPKGVKIPQTRDGVTEMVSIEDVMKRGMRGNDYRIKTTDHQQALRDFERRTSEMDAREARAKARMDHIEARDAEIKAALSDPQSAAAYEEHLAQYAKNPMYRKNVDAALSQEETQAELDVLRGREDARVVAEASKLAEGWLTSLATEYPGVDVERVRGDYARGLQAGTAQLDAGDVRRLFQAESEHVNRTLSPLQDELAALRDTVTALQAGQAAETHNETTQHAVARAKTTPVTTGKGTPGTTTAPAKKFGPNELQEQKDAWAAVR